MDLLITIFAFLLLIGVVITIHEGGHFFTALACKIRVLEFSLGFGPKIFDKEIGKDKIKFTLRALPLGGYVKPLDEKALKPEEWAALSEEEKNRSFARAKKWKKALMVAGGPASNFVLAFVIFLFATAIYGNRGITPVIGEIEDNKIMAQSGFMVGDEIRKVGDKSVDFVSDAHTEIVNSAIGHKDTNILIVRDGKEMSIPVKFSELDLRPLDDNFAKLIGMYFKGLSGDIEIRALSDNMPAKTAGLMPGDKIVSVNGEKTDDLNRVLRIIRNSPDKPVDISYLKRETNTVENIAITPLSVKERGQQVGKIGVEFLVSEDKGYKEKHYNIFQSALISGEKVVDSSMTTIISLKKIVTGEISTKAISGPLTIADYSGRSAKIGLYAYLMMMAAISIAVGIFNLVPIPLFDGGHLAQYAIEAIRRKDFTEEQLKYGQYVGFGAMGGLFALAIFNDLSKYIFYII